MNAAKFLGTCFFSTFAMTFLTTLFLAPAHAAETLHAPKDETKALEPATRYSGRTPIDLTNGIPFNNGTMGKPNPEYEAWSKDLELPGLSEKDYPFDRKDAFVDGVEEQVMFAQAAIWNWGRTSSRWPEVSEYAKNAVESLQHPLDRLTDALSKARSANQSNWASAQGEARRALVDLRLTYTQLHKNVVNR